MLKNYAKNARGRFIDYQKKWEWDRVFRSFAIPASGTSPYTKVASFTTDKSSVNCTVNDESVRTPRKNPSSTNITLLFMLAKLSQRPFLSQPLKSRHVRLMIVAKKVCPWL